MGLLKLTEYAHQEKGVKGTCPFSLAALFGHLAQATACARNMKIFSPKVAEKFFIRYRALATSWSCLCPICPARLREKGIMKLTIWPNGH